MTNKNQSIFKNGHRKHVVERRQASSRFVCRIGGGAKRVFLNGLYQALSWLKK